MGHFFSKPRKSRTLQSLLIDSMEHETLRELLASLKDQKEINDTISLLLAMEPCDLREDKVREPYEVELCQIFEMAIGCKEYQRIGGQCYKQFLDDLASKAGLILNILPTPNNLKFTV